MIKSLLVASTQALSSNQSSYLYSMAQSMGDCELHLHRFEVPEDYEFLPDIQESEEGFGVRVPDLAPGASSITKAQIEKERQEFESGLSDTGLTGSYHFTKSNPEYYLRKEIHAHDLLVVFKNQKFFQVKVGFYKTRLMHIVTQLSQPTLVLPEELTEFEWGKVLLAYDGEEASARALDYLVHLKTGYDSDLHLAFLHEHRPLDQLQEEVDNFCSHHEIDYTQSLVEKDEAKSLLETAEESACDWICLGTLKQGFFRELFFKGLDDELLQKSKLPLLLCH